MDETARLAARRRPPLPARAVHEPRGRVRALRPVDDEPRRHWRRTSWELV